LTTPSRRPIMDAMVTAARKRLTYADFEKIPSDGNRHEIIDGEWFMTPAPNLDHQGMVSELFLRLGNHIKKHRLGRVFVAPTDVLLSKNDIVEPDLVYVSRKNSSILKKKNIQGAPDLVIEVSSPSTASLDRGDKLRLYARSGVREYWIVDLFARTVEIREFGKTRRVRIYKEGQTFGSDLLPGLGISVSDLFTSLE